MKIFLVILLSWVCNLYAQPPIQEITERIKYIRDYSDHSHFYINAASENQPVSDRHTKVHFIVTDSQGRRAGFESFFLSKRGSLRVSAYREIPNAAYGVNQASSLDPTVIPNDPESVSVDFFPPVAKDTYTIQFIAFADSRYSVTMYLNNLNGEAAWSSALYDAYITSGTTQQYSIHLDPTPGAPAPVIAKTVTFDVLRNDVAVARQLNQLGDDKFARTLTTNIDLAEKLAGVCDKRKGKKDKGCEPAVAVLKLFVKRLELANRKCDNSADCDEEREWSAFRKEHGRDDDYKDFFRDWDRDDWHKHKKQCKRFITDEALRIIKEDAGWLIKSLGGKTDEEREDRGRGKHD